MLPRLMTVGLLLVRGARPLSISTPRRLAVATSALREPGAALEAIPAAEWRRAAAAHKARVRRLVGGCLTSYDGDNPIYNFLFRSVSCRSLATFASLPCYLLTSPVSPRL